MLHNSSGPGYTELKLLASSAPFTGFSVQPAGHTLEFGCKLLLLSWVISMPHRQIGLWCALHTLAPFNITSLANPS